MPLPFRDLVAAIALVLLTMTALPSQAGTDRSAAGRHISTAPKSVQQSVDGFDLQLTDPPPLPASRVLDRRGRSLRAGPTLPVSVGIIGCPGCQSEALLEGLRTYIVLPIGE